MNQKQCRISNAAPSSSLRETQGQLAFGLDRAVAFQSISIVEHSSCQNSFQKSSNEAQAKAPILAEGEEQKEIETEKKGNELGTDQG
jgi:hypothetical protein